MAGSIVTRPGRPGRKVFTALALIAAPFLIAIVIVVALLGGGLVATPADMIEAPVRATTPAGDRVYVMTSQWKTWKGPGRGPTRRTYTGLMIDLWAFDAANARPVWRRRLSLERGGVNMGRKILGAQDGVLWTLQGTGLTGLSLTDGEPVADAATIEAANPQLKGLMPTEARYYRFDGSGLSFTAADGRNWRLAGADLKVTPGPAPGTAAATNVASGVFRPARIGGGNSTWAFLGRGLHVGGGRLWFGLLSPEEAGAFEKQQAIGGIDPERYPRTRLWKAKVREVQTFFGPRPAYSDFEPLPESPEFLTAGLLNNGEVHALPILLFKPDSLLVLHRDRLGDEGRWRLTRISGPAGKVLWTVDLPMQRIEAVMPGETSVAIMGARPEKDPMRLTNDRLPVDVDQLAAVDVATGRMGVYGFKVKPTRGPDIPASSTRPPD